MAEIWHSQFNPSRFLSRIDIDKQIEKNLSYNENIVEANGRSCILCAGKQGPGLLLNDKSYLCKTCFREVARIQFPEKYEKARRQFKIEISARQLARNELIKKCYYHKISAMISFIGLTSIFLIFIKYYFAAIPIASYLIYLAADTKHKKKIIQWENQYPAPMEPVLRHFHDPHAILSSKDKAILKIFNNWPGYPPFWNYLRDVVLVRDGNRCQVSGCPSRTQLNIHHKKPVSKGGEHIPSNLITLCEFHHAIEPSEGHERVWGVIKTQFFTLVKGHKRKNPIKFGYHKVRAHVRRLKLINEKELYEIIDYYGLSCPKCESQKIKSTVFSRTQKVIIECQNCANQFVGPRKLSEETGPRLAEVLKVTKNAGNWNTNWKALETRTSSTFRLLKRSQLKNKSKKKSKNIKSISSPKCPICGSPMRLIKPKTGQKWKPFWGCTKYSETGCKGSTKT